MAQQLALAVTVLFSVLPCAGQSIRVVSEFQRIRPDGEVLSVDRVDKPREILSPAMARNAYATFRIIVAAPTGLPYTIHIGQNPENSCEVKIYQEIYAKAGDEWAPDGLAPQTLPINAVLNEGQKVQTYLLDLFVPESTGMGRFRLELQMWVTDRWIIYPLEMRPRHMTAPVKAQPIGPLAPSGARIDAAISAPLEEFVCGKKRNVAAVEPNTVRALLVRNIRQDITLAESRVPSETMEGVATMLLKAGGYAGAIQQFCESPSLSPRGAEWWLRARDYIYQGLAPR